MEKKLKTAKKGGEAVEKEEPKDPEAQVESLPEAVDEDVPTPEEKPPPTELVLTAADGSEIHLAQLGLLNLNAAVRQIQLEIAATDGKLTHLREKLTWESQKLSGERTRVLGVLSKHSVPDGWRFTRLEDGSYKFFQPPVLPPGAQLPVG